VTRPLVFATRNQGKLVELRDLLAGTAVLSIDEAAQRVGRELPDVIEDADTFVGNASKKAREISQLTGLPALADDSGLEVDALDGAPGVYSARYAGEPHSDSANNTKLLAALHGVANRTARFRAVLALADPTGPLGDEILTSAGTCEGTILTAARGTGGFGYDPLFFSPELGMTFAEAGVGPKSDLSHRARAMRELKPRLLAYLATVGCVAALAACQGRKGEPPSPPPQTAPAPATATPSPAPPAPAPPDLCAAGTRIFDHATCASAQGMKILDQAKRTLRGTLDLTTKAANTDPHALQIVCAQLIQALSRDAAAQGCTIELAAADQHQLEALMSAYYAQRTPVTNTGDAAADAVVAKIVAVRDAMCACEDMKCVTQVDKTIDSIGTFGSNAPQAARDLGGKLLDDVSRCEARLNTPAKK
jgi:XTP/dITP diphosphohydrolase